MSASLDHHRTAMFEMVELTGGPGPQRRSNKDKEAGHSKQFQSVYTAREDAAAVITMVIALKRRVGENTCRGLAFSLVYMAIFTSSGRVDTYGVWDACWDQLPLLFSR